MVSHTINATPPPPPKKKKEVVWEVIWQNVHNKQSVLLQVQSHTAFLLLLLYCAVLLNAKCYALSDDVACC